jgi:hypothetical protein
MKNYQPGLTANDNPLLAAIKWGSKEYYELYLIFKNMGWDGFALMALAAGMHTTISRLPDRRR